MFVDFTKGHWLTLYRDRLPPSAPVPAFGVMAKNSPPAQLAPDAPAIYAGFPPSFMFKMLIAWAKMGFRRPKMTW